MAAAIWRRDRSSNAEVEIPENVEPVEVPLGRALAIANRLGKLAAV